MELVHQSHGDHVQWETVGNLKTSRHSLPSLSPVTPLAVLAVQSLAAAAYDVLRGSII